VITVKTFWCHYNPNFGDALNRELFRRLGGIDIEYAPADEARVTGIGSILDKVFTEPVRPGMGKGALRVFSSGFDADPTAGVLLASRFPVSVAFRRKLVCSAVRGVKTADALRALMPDVRIGAVGDGGLLLKYLVHGRIEPKHRVGIVPHYVERGDPAFGRLVESIDGAVLLDPREGVEAFLQHLRECRTVVSTALHPLIACDALGIPNQWLRFPESVISRFKFEDYYSIYETAPQPFDPRVCAPDLLSEEAIRARYGISVEKVSETQERLREAFACLCRDLQRPWWRRLISR